MKDEQIIEQVASDAITRISSTYPKALCARDHVRAWARMHLANQVQLRILERTFSDTPESQHVKARLISHQEYLANIDEIKNIPKIQPIRDIDDITDRFIHANPLPLVTQLVAETEYGRQVNTLRSRYRKPTGTYPVHINDAQDFTNYVTHLSKILDQNAFDIVLGVLWKGSPYAQLIESLGRIPVIHCQVTRKKAQRSYSIRGNAELLRGQRILLAEDDFITGSTLEGLLAHIAPYRPKTVSIYFGAVRKGGRHEQSGEFPAIIREFDRMILADTRILNEKSTYEEMKYARNALEPFLKPHYAR